LIRNNEKILSDAVIKIDGKRTKNFLKILTSDLRYQIGNDKLKKITFVDSRTDSLIQLADMIVGAIARTNNSKAKDKNRWLEILQKNKRIDIEIKRLCDLD
jgi:hypothetical protein